MYRTDWKGTPGSDQRERRTETKVRTAVEGKTGVGIPAAANEAALGQRTGEPTECRGKCPDFKRKSRHLSQGTLTVSESRKKAGAKGNDSNRGTGKRVLEESQIPENGERTRGTAKKEMETFIKEVMDNSEFTEEQSDYLLTCLERGDKVEDVLYLAKPSLSVEHMERMRKMEQKRRMEASGQKTQKKRYFWEREKN